jgi:acyl transferase domain-containing protein/NAD(P)H-dependent flavin oxidoreductase YrpB (nitropropane dioxygenase family)/NAD(P)-dependent dehydrogenase (short-subunit alcohol dehydrogenase family)
VGVYVVTPFEVPDVSLALSASQAGAFPILHLGRDRNQATCALESLSQRLAQPFGVCFADEAMTDISLPSQVSTLVLPWGFTPPTNTTARILWQVRSVDEAREALATKPEALIAKGAEGAGACGVESSFLLFQHLIGPCKQAGVDLYIQGGVGVHSAAAYVSLGVKGVVLDSQVALFPECSAPAETKASIARLSGSELRSCENYRYLLRFGAADPGPDATLADLAPRIGITEAHDCIPLGQDSILAADYLESYRRLKYLVQAIRQAAYSQVRLAKEREVLSANDGMSTLLGTHYPLAQGPMARISDVPLFLRDVADAGALPFLAMSMMVGSSAEKALKDTADAMEDKPWGVGILGFAYPKMIEEQTRLILETKPSVVLIAGGRPSLAKAFEQEGIKTFLHVPAVGLLDMFLKEGSRSFIFEGRESGGHVGPLFSTVLWEKQINRLLAHDDPSSLNVFFAGGVHDELSSAFVRILTTPLVARDVKVGLIVGTAYLFTEEIVARKAITKDYQKLLIKGDSTLLLKSGHGQETRSVPSAFTDFFQSERQRLADEGLEGAQILMKLEELNLGRLRIASKGIERRGDELVALSAKEQRDQGLFMTGAVTPLIDGVTTIAKLHQQIIEGGRALVDALPLADEVPSSAAETVSLVPDTTSVAVIGMAGIFPDAANIDEYWRNILFGKNSITEVPPERWSTELFYDPEGKDTDHVVSKWGGFIDAVDFDAFEFGITPQSLAAIEPVQLLSLLVTKRAFEDAGFDDLSLVDLDNTSVIFGAQGAGELTAAYGSRSGLRQLFGELTEDMDEMLPRLTEDSFPGVLSNVIAGRISNRLNTGGRNFTVDAACASSLAALDIALSELTSNRAEMVVLGGADLHNSINDFLMFSSTYALSKKGQCATFDAEADGITLGEGIGVLILKRLEDAQRDGNTIHAVIKGIGASSDGKHLGLTAPSKRGQVRALQEAYASAGIQPSDVGLIEAHGTGTVVGDRIELSALTDVFLDAAASPARTQLGSVKTQIGHTKCAAGVAGLIKTVLSVKHGIRPATLNLNAPNSAYAKNGPFFFRTEGAGLWNEDRRIAGVSGFGFGGTNFHALLENVTPERPEVTLKAWPTELLVFRGATPEEAKGLMEKITALCAINNRLALKDIAYSLSQYNKDEDGQAIQYAIVADSVEELLARIGGVLNDASDAPDASGEGIYALDPVDGKVAFLFPGQGSQRVNMAGDLFVLFPQMRRLLDAHPDYESILLPAATFTLAEKKAQRAAITDTRNAQPLLGIVDLAIAKLLEGFGVTADMLAGHSYGELPALCFAGVVAEDDLVELSRARAESILDVVGDDPGRMVAVRTDRETLDGLLAGETEVWAVNFNAPKQTVVAGTSTGIEAFLNKLGEAGVSSSELNVAGAFHSPLLAEAEGRFAAVLKNTKLGKATLPVWSNTTAEPYPKAATAIKKRLAEHLVNPVRFTDELERMYAEGARIFIETGPGAVLTGLVDKTITDETTVLIQTERDGAQGLRYLLHTLACYVSTGRGIHFDHLFTGRGATMLEIDEPEQYRKRGTVWNVDGLKAVPENGELPAHAGTFTIGSPFSINDLQRFGNVNVEQIMMAYLDNMNGVIQDQRDVMLGYLGQSEAIPRAAAMPRQFTTALAETDASASEAIEVAAEVIEDDALPDIVGLSTDEIRDLILAVVSEKTGYPTDMLDFDANLEADLSIDSIKKMEIVGGLRERATFPDDEEDMEASFEKLISIKSLNEMLEWIDSLKENIGKEKTSTKDAAFEGVQAVVDTAPVAESLESLSINRLTFAERPMPLGEKDAELLKDANFAITDDGSGLAKAVAEALAAEGATATLITAETGDLAAFDGLVLINAATSANHYTISDLFTLIKQADFEKLRWIYTFDDGLGTLLEAEDLSRLDLLEGFAGFVKSLKHEHPAKSFCSVSFHTAIDPETFAAIVAGELSNPKPFPEIHYRGAERFYFLPELEDLASEDEGGEATTDGLGLNEDSHILVLGGAQGITPILTSRLAEKYPCTYILVGRSAKTHDSEAYRALGSIGEIRDYLIKEEGMKQPKEIEKKAHEIFKENQIDLAIKRFEDVGAKASYRNADVRDAEAFRALINELKEDGITIDGVVHAAGILEDKLFNNKELASFERVYGTKVDPLHVILAELLPDLKLLVMFSSTSSTFGNVGQSDYASGNCVMDNVALLLAHHRPEIRALAFNWGPWKGAGMVNEGLEQEFRRRGIAFLTLDAGGDFFVNEIIRGNKPGVVGFAGSKEGLNNITAALLA